MSINLKKLSPEEITNLIQSLDPKVRNTMSSLEAAEFLKSKLSTVYSWVQNGYLNGTYRKRGKHLNFVTRRLVERFYNDKDWS